MKADRIKRKAGIVLYVVAYFIGVAVVIQGFIWLNERVEWRGLLGDWVFQLPFPIPLVIGGLMLLTVMVATIFVVRFSLDGIVHLWRRFRSLRCTSGGTRFFARDSPV